MNGQSPRDMFQDLTDAVRANPLPAALIGMGAMWLLTGGEPVRLFGAAASSVGDGASRALGSISDAGSRVGEAARSATQSVSETAASLASSVAENGASAARNLSESAQSMGRSALDRALPGEGDFLSRARGELTTLLRERPLFLGAIGLAIGAGIAAAAPATALEAGMVSPDMKRKAGEMGAMAREQASRLTAAARDLAGAAASEAEAQGFTVEGVKAQASDAAQRVTSVAEAASEGLIRRLN